MSTLWRAGCLVLTLLVIANQLARAEESGAAAAAKPADAPPTGVQPAEASSAPAATLPASADGESSADFPIHGYLKSRYVGRWIDHASDHDIFETLSLDAGDPDRNRVTAHFLGSVDLDIDGSGNNQGYYAFDSAKDAKHTDAKHSDAEPEIYSLYLDIHRVGCLSILRAGRQSIYETPEISFFDGLRAETRELGAHRVKLGLYGGIPVYLYQGYSSGDFLGGAYAESHLWPGARARIDAQRLEGRNGTALYRDTLKYRNILLGVSGWQSLGRYVDLHARYTQLDGEDRDVLARGTFTQPEWNFRFQSSYYQQLQTRQDAVIQADAYYPILKDYVPFYECRWMASKGFADRVNIDAGMDIRRLAEDQQESAYNHEFDRYFATVAVYDLLVKDSSISLTGEKWTSSDRDSESQGLDVSSPIGEKCKLSVGTAHYLYKYDYYADQERDDIQNYYMKFDYKHSKALRFSASYDYEDDGTSVHYNELRCEAICSF